MLSAMFQRISGQEPPKARIIKRSAITAGAGLPRLLRRVMRGGGLMAGALMLAACDPGTSTGPSTGPIIDPAQPVNVALLVPGPSDDANLSWLSRSLSNAARMAAADSQGANIDLRIYNAGSDAGTAVARAQEAVSAGAKIIVGPLHGEAANAVGNAVSGDGINVLTFSNNPDIAGGNVFLLGNTFDNTANRLVHYATSQGRKRFVVVAEDDLAGQVGARSIKAAIARTRGAALVGEMPHQVSRGGIDGVVPSIAAAAKSGQADTIFMTANNDAVLPYMSEALREAGVNQTGAQLMGLTRWDQPAERLALPGLQNGWFATPDKTRLDAFEARYRAAYGEAPHPLAGLAYDGVSAVAAGVRAGKRNALTTAGLTQKAGFQGVNGVFRFNRDGTNSRALAVATIRNQQLVILDPAPQGTSGYGF